MVVSAVMFKVECFFIIVFMVTTAIATMPNFPSFYLRPSSKLHKVVTNINMLPQVRDGFSEIFHCEVAKTIGKKAEFDQRKASLLEHPGFPLSTGCDYWSSSGYNGSVTVWSSAPYINWMASSSMVAVDALAGKPISHRELYIRPSYAYDMPSLKMSLSTFQNSSPNSNSYRLSLDYIPREDVLSSYQYFDKYFKGLDDAIYSKVSIASDKGLLKQRLPDESLLTRLLTSAFAINVDVSEEGVDVMEDLCMAHLERWCGWLLNATELVDECTKRRILDRDISIQKFHHNELKFSIARILGSSFAPKAEYIAATIVGPAL